jgi:transcriptional regulator with XRE-family HTH domain
MSFGSNLQDLRNKAGLSQSELAAKAGIPVKTIQSWEIDRALPRVDALIKLSQALDVPLEALTSGVDASKKSSRSSKATPSTPPAAELEATGKKPRSRRGKSI